MLKTAKSGKKALRNLRVADDDERRYREIWEALCIIHEEYQPHVIAMENYQPYKAVGSGAWKVARVCGLIMGWAMSRPSLAFVSFSPQDLKRGSTGQVGASKEQVAEALYDKVHRLQICVKVYPKTQHEHLADAAGHAYLAFGEIEKLRQSLGLGGVM